MQKNVFLPLLILAIAGTGIILLFNNKNIENEDSVSQTESVPNISTDIIWNSYSFDNVPFIYPATWIFEEVKDPSDSKKVIAFKIAYPSSPNPLDVIEAGGPCPKVPTVHSACFGNVWLRTESEDTVVLGIFEDMIKFGEKTVATP